MFLSQLLRRITFPIFGLIFIGNFSFLFSQNGIPFITNYPPKVYKADAQNWAITQDKRGVIYFGNTNGLLEYDGVNWRIIKLPNNLGVRSLATDKNGRVYVGSLNEFGFIGPDSIGNMKYFSLMDKVKPGDKNFADVWKVFALSDRIIFQTFSSIFWLKNDLIHVKKSETKYQLSYVVNDVFYINQPGKGILKLKNDSLVVISDSKKIRNIAAMVPFGHDESGKEQILVPANWGDGVFVYNGTSARHFSTQADSFIAQSMVYCSSRLSERSFALGTINGGAVILDGYGKAINLLNKAIGLQDEMVIDCYLDNQSALWLGFNYGISRVEVLSPITLFNEKFDLKGSVESIVFHLGELYVAGTHGTFKLIKLFNNKEDTIPGININSVEQQIQNQLFYKFEQVGGIDMQSWALLSVNDVLLASTNRCVYKYENQKSENIYDEKAFSLYRSKIDSSRVFIGLLDGLASLYNDKGKWIKEGRVENVSEQIRSITESNDGSLWLGTLYQGIIRIEFPKKYTYRSKIDQNNKILIEIETNNIQHFDTTHGLPSGEIGVFQAGTQLGFATRKGLYRFSQNIYNGKISFYKDSLLDVNQLYDNPAISRIYTAQNHNVWMRVGDISGMAMKKSDGSYGWHYKPFLRLPEGQVWSFYTQPEGITWIGGDFGLIRYDPAILKNYGKNYNALIRKVTIGRDSIVFGGNFKDKNGIVSLVQDITQIPVFSFENNSVIFEFATPSFDNEELNEYQYFLENFDKEWSNWTMETKKEYTNLPEEVYQFKIKARNVYKHESQEGIYKFEILPPFYKTWWFFGGQIFFFMLMFGSTIYFSRSGTNTKIVTIMVTISMIIIFEYIQNTVEDNFSDILGGIAFFKVLLNVVLAILLFPAEILIRKLLQKKTNKIEKEK